MRTARKWTIIAAATAALVGLYQSAESTRTHLYDGINDSVCQLSTHC